MEVLTDHEHWIRSGRVGEERQRSDAGEEGGRRFAGVYAEGDIECITLRPWQFWDLIVQRPQQKVEPRVRCRGLIRGAEGSKNSHPPFVRPALQLVHQCGLPDTGIAIDQQRRPACVELGALRIEQREFGLATDEVAFARHPGSLAHLGACGTTLGQTRARAL